MNYLSYSREKRKPTSLWSIVLKILEGNGKSNGRPDLFPRFSTLIMLSDFSSSKIISLSHHFFFLSWAIYQLPSVICSKFKIKSLFSSPPHISYKIIIIYTLFWSSIRPSCLLVRQSLSIYSRLNSVNYLFWKFLIIHFTSAVLVGVD